MQKKNTFFGEPNIASTTVKIHAQPSLASAQSRKLSDVSPPIGTHQESRDPLRKSDIIFVLGNFESISGRVAEREERKQTMPRNTFERMRKWRRCGVCIWGNTKVCDSRTPYLKAGSKRNLQQFLYVQMLECQSYIHQNALSPPM